MICKQLQLQVTIPKIICKQLYGFKYSYLIHLVAIQLYGFKYFSQIEILLHKLLPLDKAVQSWYPLKTPIIFIFQMYQVTKQVVFSEEAELSLRHCFPMTFPDVFSYFCKDDIKSVI